MTRSDRLADQLDRHWQKNLRPRWEGLTDEEYFWEPVRGCWSVRPRGASDASAGAGEWTVDYASPAPEPAPVTTIAWRMAHIVVSCLGYRVGWHFGGQDVDSDTYPYAGTADEALKQLDDMYGRWNAGVRELSDADLENPPAVGPEQFPMEGIVLHVNRELIHHGAEISLLRDLYRRQELPRK
ncbi:DinB family protein [Actinacidiphila bryophytorum]|uniref:Serine/arginine repetitive matrix protein 1 n=1 Tax=Actinacidiphila bryophytorum TaxID=1436133 RepID=A0A9W4H3I0_9ACTN|nr:DinB family protein [Actinacidiphila bryophytorum]MBM9438148.1 DinB family protein [Actinacidiphila bryophytorum]MBN6544415.1 DinB family protein [Actinacidiphila bryophytorum]CAG7647610.1 Serine/arginine repetitive matrix protein 1 [Actinacidiphila bryophytorum]